MVAFFTGLFLGLSLIIAIGAQNAFVIRQGVLKQHTLFIALFCSIADSLLICLGVIGISYLFKDFIYEFSHIIFGISSLWLAIYGIFRIHSAFRIRSSIYEHKLDSNNLIKTISTLTVFTFANPHVYLDTMILIGSVSQQFMNISKVYFSLGACTASFLWFFFIAYGARIISPLIQTPSHWRNLDLSIALVMFIIAFNLARQGAWL
jgi:L-lysine exporter family protein LysE/ArgO